MKRVLIVSPRFVPSNAADMHRVRQVLPYLREAGWEPTVLAVEPNEVEAPQDPLLLRTIPDDVEVVRVGAVPIRWTRRLGVGSLEARSILSLAQAGDALLRERAFDLVFFSTAAAGVSVLGPRWLRRHGTPYMIDLHDPWYSRYYDRHADMTPPGGRFKYTVSNEISRRLEPYVLRRAAHVVSVSPAYPRELAERYPWFAEDRATVLPFGAPEADFAALRRQPVPNVIFAPDDGLVHWVYTGATGHMMALSLSALFRALAAARAADPATYDRVRLHFVGTSYAPGDRGEKTVEPIAAEHGVADLVQEQPRRIPYFEALQCLLDAHALLVPGSDDPGYTASKVYPYVLARKPLLAIFHEASTVIDVLRQSESGVVVPFGDDASPEAVAEEVRRAWFKAQAWADPPEADWGAFEPFTAREMTRRLAAAFDCALDA